MRIALLVMIGAVASPLHAQRVEDTPVRSDPQPNGPLELHLVCRGTGERKVHHGAAGMAFSGGQTATVVGSTTSLSQFGEQLDLDVSGGNAKARVPRRFLPKFHGGNGGWFDLQEMVVTPDVITGKVGINFANHPNLRVDRRTGSVSLDGKVGSFAGECMKIDPDQHAF